MKRILIALVLAGLACGEAEARCRGRLLARLFPGRRGGQCASGSCGTSACGPSGCNVSYDTGSGTIYAPYGMQGLQLTPPAPQKERLPMPPPRVPETIPAPVR